MHRGDWNSGMGGGSWMLMAIVMIAFWAALLWIVVTMIRHRDHTPHLQPSGLQPPVAVAPARLTPQEILAERLARGEIEPDDYRQRIDALRHNPQN